MMHDYHPSLEGYNERQILHDGCSECERRGKDVVVALAHMDDNTFARAWERAYNWQASQGDMSKVGRISRAEIPLLRTLWQFQVMLERRGVPLTGTLPGPYKEMIGR
jgi:hypothetical protein